jgi:hypothetical protein
LGHTAATRCSVVKHWLEGVRENGGRVSTGRVEGLDEGKNPSHWRRDSEMAAVQPSREHHSRAACAARDAAYMKPHRETLLGLRHRSRATDFLAPVATPHLSRLASQSCCSASVEVHPEVVLVLVIEVRERPHECVRHDTEDGEDEREHRDLSENHADVGRDHR